MNVEFLKTRNVSSWSTPTFVSNLTFDETGFDFSSSWSSVVNFEYLITNF